MVWMLLPTMSDCEVMDWEDVFLLFAVEPRLKDQKNVMNWSWMYFPAPVMPTGDQLLCFSCCRCACFCQLCQ